MRVRVLLAFILALAAAYRIVSATPDKARYLTREEVRDVLSALHDVAPPEARADWGRWVVQHDREVRNRVERGEEDSLANFLLFGISYTQQPRITAEGLSKLSQGHLEDSAEEGVAAGKIVMARADDLMRALAAPRENERVAYLRAMLERKGLDAATPAGQSRLKAYLIANLLRVFKEQRSYATALEAARQTGDTTAEFAERSKLYHDRGLSSDTSWMPNLAIEESLKTMLSERLLAPGSVRRAAVLGPGLDFIDKRAGYDFYPQQTIQPFALVDTLLRLGLAKADQIDITTFDISPRVNAHLERAVKLTRTGPPYVVQLPRDPRVSWTVGVVNYWDRFGSEIGNAIEPMPVPPAASPLKLRAVRIRPAIVARLSPVDLNVVTQTLDPAAKFDLIVATNIFVYYDAFEQGLALASIEHMLRPGGFLLSNHSLPVPPGSHMRSVDYLTVVYSDRPDDGDHLVWYQRN